MSKKLIVISRSTPVHFKAGGMETQLVNLLNALKIKGYECDVITTSYPVELYKEEIKDIGSSNVTEGDIKNDVLYKDIIKNVDGVTYYFLKGTTPGLRSLTLWERMFYHLGFLKRYKPEGNVNFYKTSASYLQKLNKTKNYRLIISQSTNGQGLLNIKDDSIKTLPVISIIHGAIKSEIKNRFGANKSFFNWVRFLGVDIPVWGWELMFSNKAFFNYVNNVVAVSDDTKQEFLNDHPGLSKKTVVIPNGVDSDTFKPRLSDDKKHNNFNILYIGRIDREKGIDLIISIASKLDKTQYNIKFNVIGDGVHFNEMKSLAEMKKLSNIKFLGKIENSETPGYYRESDIFLFPSRRNEGHPMTVSEAFCSGLPVIATKAGGLKDIVNDGVNGYLVEKEDINSIVERIIYLYDNKQVLEKMSVNARDKGLKYYSLYAMADRYDNLIKHL